ncbi:MAG: porin family protein [Verrucomicrobiota bacterium]
MSALPLSATVFFSLCIAVGILCPQRGWGQVSESEGGLVIDERGVEAAMTAGRYDEALDLLASLDEKTATDSFLLRWKAFCLVAVGQYAEALVVADRLLELDAADSYAAFYRAQALAGLEKISEAAEQLAAVIENNENSAAAHLIESELPEFVETGELSVIVMEADKRLRASLSLGVGYDDNVALVPEGGRLASGKASSYVQSQLSLDYGIVDQNEIHVPVSLSLGGGFYRSHYFDNGLDEFDYMIIDPRLTLRHERQVFGHEVVIEMGGLYRKAWFGDSSYYDAWGLSASFDYAITAGMHFKVIGEWTNTAFAENPDFPSFFGRDGDAWRVTAALSGWTFNNRVWMNFGYTYEIDDASGIQLSYQLHRAFAQAYVNLPAKVQLGLGANYGNPDYRNYVPDPNREDDAMVLFASLSRPLWSPEWVASMNYTYMRNRSNQSFANYDRNILLLQMSYSY